jgi:hypothetical protein
LATDINWHYAAYKLNEQARECVVKASIRQR